MNKDLKKKITKIMENSEGFITNNNYKIVELKENYCKLEGTITENSLNPYGIVHGGYIFGLADTAGGIAVATTGRRAVTTNSTITYLHKATGKKLMAKANCIKSGENIAIFETNIFDDYNNLVSKVLLEYFYL